ncbi:MAG TPA: hypothetical protein VM324_15670 [Egibacteraceae bacterium]|jgi:hypothetical protein|nr:hypothetical protein [Egibacteraceae bacterium]
MSERTRANTNAEGRTRTDVEKEPGEWVEPALDENEDLVGDSGSRPRGDQVTKEMADTMPEMADRQPEDRSDFAAPTGGDA